MVGSFGRHTAIKNISDLDMLFILPNDIRERYNSDTGPRRILERVRDALKSRYPKTEITVDQCIVRVQFVEKAFKFEIQPVFESSDGSFQYPDTKAKDWKTTKPREEINATKECNDRTSNNMRHLARMIRAWKNTWGVNMGGLLIDTLVHNFFENNHNYNSASTSSFDLMVKDFFKFLKDQPEQTYYLALGSKQQVKVKDKFQTKAKKAYNRCVEALHEKQDETTAGKWREIFGAAVPTEAKIEQSSFRNTEQFIEYLYPIDITGTVSIDCEVTVRGWRPTRLREMLLKGIPLTLSKNLEFFISACSITEPYAVKWKVLNRGSEAERRDSIRGEIIGSTKGRRRVEHSHFKGDHIVECYIIKNEVVVARDRIKVPIENNKS